jgi:hypothetical protein
VVAAVDHVAVEQVLVVLLILHQILFSKVLHTQSQLVVVVQVQLLRLIKAQMDQTHNLVH